MQEDNDYGSQCTNSDTVAESDEGQGHVQVTGANIKEIVENLEKQYPGLKERLV